MSTASTSEQHRAHLTTSTPPEEPLATFPSLQLDEPASDDDDDGSDDGGHLPKFRLPAAAPQLDSLSLPSPLFNSSSFVDLLSPFGTSSLAASSSINNNPDSRPSSRLRTSSTARSFYDRGREPTLNFSRPRPLADTRKRREGRDEADVFVAAFPDDELELGAEGEPAQWDDSTWHDVGAFLSERGYILEPRTASSSIPARRESDSLPLYLHVVPVDDVSFELDVLEYLAGAGLKTNAKAHGVVALVPVVGLVPLSEDWTAVLTERWDAPSSVPAAEFAKFAIDIVGLTESLPTSRLFELALPLDLQAIAFLHQHHVAHLALSPSTLAVSPTLPTRYTLSSFVNSVQVDALAKKPSVVTGDASSSFGAPEMSSSKAVDPYAVDVFALGKILGHVAEASRVSSSELAALVKELTSTDPKARPRASAALARLKTLFS
ncbi:hypothetical protein MNV49_003818 [Pseudohyphozyma bogoriensis]|nr:hypothetical protein MNV49_003818 [Pseudohyphozyma bogoriensis]